MYIPLPVLHHLLIDPCSIYRADFTKERFHGTEAVTRSLEPTEHDTEVVTLSTLT